MNISDRFRDTSLAYCYELYVICSKIIYGHFLVCAHYYFSIDIALNPLSSIIIQNKLDGDNYVDCKYNLDTVLMIDKHKWVLTTPCSNEPIVEYTNDQIVEYWKASDEMAKCYILGFMNSILQQQHRGIETATDIMFSIDEMFVNLGRQEK